MKETVRLFLTILLVIGALLYAAGVIYVGVQNLQDNPAIPEVINNFLSGMGTVLALNLGAFLGISTTFRNGLTKMARELPTQEQLRLYASIFYVVMLFVAVIFWALDGFSSESARLLQEMANSLVGVLIGAVTVILGVEQG
jgi:di/tricarboxylate transporter